MSVQSVDTVMQRIASTTPLSPLSVYRSFEPGTVECWFSNTWINCWRRDCSPNYVGTFHRGMNLEQVRMLITRASISPMIK